MPTSDQLKTPLDSPALKVRSELYPTSWHQRVPKRVKMAKTVGSDFEFIVTREKRMIAQIGVEYDCWVNSNGAVCAFLEDDRLAGLIEVDETFVGGKEKNKHEAKKLRAGRGAVGKTIVLGMRERTTGRVRGMVIEGTDSRSLQGAIHANIKPGSMIHTDEAMGYEGLEGLWFNHRRVNHGAGEYARGLVNTNSIESVWAVLKRSIIGTWHQVSPKHLGRYVDEVTFRLNAGNVAIHTLDRLDSFIAAVDGKRLTYERLIA